MRGIDLDPEFTLFMAVFAPLITCIALVRTLLRVRRLLRAGTERWETRRRDASDAQLQYRSPAAAMEAGPPLAVRRSAYGLVIWVFISSSTWLAAAVVGVYFGWLRVLYTLPVCMLAGIHLIETAYALCKRADARMEARIRRTRALVSLHHLLWFAFGTYVVLSVLGVVDSSFSLELFLEGPTHALRYHLSGASALAGTLCFSLAHAVFAVSLLRVMKAASAFYPSSAK